MVKSMLSNASYCKRNPKRKCRPFTDGKKVCGCQGGWSVFFATVNKMGADETKPRPKKATTQEAVEKILEWYKGLGKAFIIKTKKAPSYVSPAKTTTTPLKSITHPPKAVGLLTGYGITSEPAKPQGSKLPAGTKTTGRISELQRLGKSKKKTKKQRKKRGKKKRTQESKRKIIKWFMESTLKSSDLPAHAIPKWVGLAQKVLKSSKFSPKVKAYWRNRLEELCKKNPKYPVCKGLKIRSKGKGKGLGKGKGKGPMDNPSRED